MLKQLSSELDALLLLVFEALDNSQKCKAHRRSIEGANQGSPPESIKGTLLRALLPILNLHIDTAETALAHATCESFGICRILSELEACANDLGKFAEQNHTLADQLDHFMAPGQNNILSSEKRAIAEIEEAVVREIDNLRVLATSCSSIGNIQNEGTSASNDNGHSPFTTMRDLCERLFPPQKHSSAVEPRYSLQKKDFSESQITAADALQGLYSYPPGNTI